MVTRKIDTGVGKVWAFYPDRDTAKRYDGDSTLLTVTDEQVVFLTANPYAEWDGENFVVPEKAEVPETEPEATESQP